MRAARRRALFPKKASPVLLRVPRPDVSRETFVPLSHCNAMNCFTWNIASGKARAVAHMTLPERNARRHDADEAPRANPCARGIGRTMGDSADRVDCAGRRGDIGRVGRSRLRSEYRYKRVRGTRSEGAAHSRDGELKLPALFDGGMSLRGMHAHTLP